MSGIILPAAVVFDMDGVIFDTENLRLGFMCALAGKYGLDRIEELYDSITGTTEAETERRYYAFYGPRLPYAAIREEARIMEENYVAAYGPPLKPGVRELMAYLGEQNIPVGLASSGDLSNIRFLMERAGLVECFQAIVSGDMIKNSKPAPDIYLAACKALGVEPPLAYAVEDAYHGIEAAYRAGMMPVMVPDRLPPTEETRRRCAMTCESLAEFKKALEATK